MKTMFDEIFSVQAREAETVYTETRYTDKEGEHSIEIGFVQGWHQ